MAPKDKKQVLLSRIGNNSKKQKTQGKMDKNPLLMRLNNDKKPQNGVKEDKKMNPLLAALTSDRTKVKGNRVSKPVNVQRKDKRIQLTRINQKQSQHDQQQQEQHHHQHRHQGPKRLVLKIKNASTPDFLKIDNLETGTTAEDLRRVLQSIAPVKVVKVKEMGSNCTGEVIFQNDNALKEACRQLDGAIADGRVLQAKITNDSVTGINVK